MNLCKFIMKAKLSGNESGLKLASPFEKIIIEAVRWRDQHGNLYQ